MSEKQNALDDLERVNGDLDTRAALTLKILINAGLPCRAYAGVETLEGLADAVHNLWHHLCQLDCANLDKWSMNVLELASIYGSGIGARTFTNFLESEETREEKLMRALGDMIEHFERFVESGSSEFSDALAKSIVEDAKKVYDEESGDSSERWPTTGSEESFRKLSSDEMLAAGFTLDCCTYAEFQAFRDKCDEEDEAEHQRTNDAMDKLSDDLN
tara:strand:+ start:494 stop:1141 length:648 start_codon:yes stop_codon:yes gene_type:complete